MKEGKKEGGKEAGKEGRKEAIGVLSWRIFSPAGFQSLRLQPEVEAALGSNEPPFQKPNKAATDAGSVFKGLGGLKDDGDGDPVYQPSSRFSVLLAVAEINELLLLLLPLLQ